MYILQGLYTNGYVLFEDSIEDEQAAIKAGKELIASPTFEGDCTRVITIDGELVWASVGAE